jgi:hypothetical protein
LRDRAEFTDAYFVAPDLFHVLGVRPLYGRVFDDDASAVVSGVFARRHFSTVRDVLGTPLSIENRTCTVTGVMPAGFDFPGKADVWVPAPATPDNHNRAAIQLSEPGPAQTPA